MGSSPSVSFQGLRLSMVRQADAIEPVWRALEATGIHAPYQRFDFVQAWRASFEPGAEKPLAAFLVSDGEAAPMALLPLEVERIGPVRAAQFCGGKHANFGMPLLASAFARTLPAAETPALLRAMGEMHGEIDLFALTHQPLGLAGLPNPFAGAPNARPSPELVLRAALGADDSQAAERIVSKSSRKKLAAKERRLGDLGPVTHRRAATAVEAEALLGAFFEQKAQRSTALGLPNPFADAQSRRFLLHAATDRLAAGSPALEVHALICGETPVAVFGAATTSRWMSGSIISHSADPRYERFSPGEVLLLSVLRDAGRRGFESFDLGVGGGAYKASFCKEPFPLADSFTPVTMLGRAAAPLLARADSVKAVIKRDPRLLRVAKRLAPLVRAS